MDQTGAEHWSKGSFSIFETETLLPAEPQLSQFEMRDLWTPESTGGQTRLQRARRGFLV